MAKPLLCPFQPTNKKEKLKTFYTKSIFYSQANVKRRKLRRGKTKEIVTHARKAKTDHKTFTQWSPGCKEKMYYNNIKN